MRQTKFALALLTAAVLSACGGTGSSGGDQTHAVKFSQQVSFGDSLSDVGTYAVGAVAAAGGGKFTINGNNTSANAAYTGLNWTEVLASELKLPAPCAAQTGLQGADNANPALDFNVPIVNHANCFNYAQGGARVTDPVGAGYPVEMTVPVVTQIDNHLAKTGGKFSGTELVTVMAGGNDVLVLLGQISSAGNTAFATSLIGQLAAGATNPAAAAQAIGATIQAETAKGSSTQVLVGAAVTTAAQQPGNAAVGQPSVYGPMVIKAEADGKAAAAKYAADNSHRLVTELGTAGAELANMVKTRIIANGAKYVLVNNLPDVASTPTGKAQSPELQTLIKTMVDTFNAELKAGLGEDPRIAYVDVFSVSRDQVANPAIYGLTNTAVPACTSDSSLTCTGKTLSGPDVSHYMFADGVHPTPYENWLVARYVLKDMAVKGWL